MSMIANYRRITPKKLAELQAHPETIGVFLYEDGGLLDEPDEPYADLDIDKAWHGIHFLLTGSAWEGEPPLRDAVLGGTELGDEDVGYGPARFLTPEEVEAVAGALSSITPGAFGERFDASALAAGDIYPEIWQHESDSLDYLLQHYGDLRRFFADAAEQGDAMLLYLN